jgi:hypothetical protein
MPFLVTSAAGVNGDGYGMLLAFDRTGRSLGAFSSDPRISDPRGLAVAEPATWAQRLVAGDSCVRA